MRELTSKGFTTSTVSTMDWISYLVTEDSGHQVTSVTWPQLTHMDRDRQNVMLLIFSRELLHTTKMGSQLTGPLSSCWNSTALTPGLSLVYKISFPCLYFYIATWSFDNRYISAGKHLIHKMFTLYTVFPLWSWWLAWKALNYVTYWIFLSGLDARGVPVITFQIDYNLRNIP